MTVNPPDFLPLYVSTHNTGKWHSEPLINLLFALCRFKSTIITQSETQKTPEYNMALDGGKLSIWACVCVLKVSSFFV